VGGQAGVRKKQRLPAVGRRTECGGWAGIDEAERRLFPGLDGSLRRSSLDNNDALLELFYARQARGEQSQIGLHDLL
jgi:hypothetical protein